MTIVCNIWQAFAGMSAQSVLDHHSGCKAKYNKECVEHEGAMKAHKKKKSQRQKEVSESHGSDAAKKS